jgi:YesN/AraC family two-component response regulator
MTPKELRNLTKTLRVLYVEDDKFLREATTKMFGQFFGTIDQAEDGQEGWEAYQENDYDLVITDINMPNLNGVEMLKLIKKSNPDQAAIVTSAYNDADSLLSLIDIGIDKFLLKPMDITKVIDSLVHTALYIQNVKSNFEAAQRIAQLESEVAKLKKQLSTSTTQDRSIQECEASSELSKEENKLLETLETKLSKAIYDIQMQGDYPDHLKENILSSLDKYAEILYKYHEEVAKQLNKLDQSLEQDETQFQSNLNHHCSMLEDVCENLRTTRKKSFNEASSHQLIKSMKRVMATLRV